MQEISINDVDTHQIVQQRGHGGPPSNSKTSVIEDVLQNVSLTLRSSINGLFIPILNGTINLDTNSCIFIFLDC